MLRVIGGDLKGRALKAPPGLKTRPTSSVVREAVFDILGAGVAGSEFLDLYAGSGAIGIESLSRGASFCLFVESHYSAVNYLRANLRSLGLDGRSRILKMASEKALAVIGESGLSFRFVFLDPPYGDPGREKILDSLSKSESLSEGAKIIVEYGSKSKPVMPQAFEEIKSYTYGDSSLLLARKR